MELTIAGVIKESIVDGPGIRYTVFTQGCPHHCPGCHNPQTWAFEGGQRTTPQALFEDFQKDPILKGVTFSGGEPFCQPERQRPAGRGGPAHRRALCAGTAQPGAALPGQREPAPHQHEGDPQAGACGAGGRGIAECPVPETGRAERPRPDCCLFNKLVIDS